MTLTKSRLVILDGWGHPQAPNKLNSIDPSEGAEERGFVCVTAVLGGEEDNDANRALTRMLEEYLPRSGATVVADFRGHKITEGR
jgi:hypothetical protein